jgi:tRNA G10  N-methylase Trm11
MKIDILLKHGYGNIKKPDHEKNYTVKNLSEHTAPDYEYNQQKTIGLKAVVQGKISVWQDRTYDSGAVKGRNRQKIKRAQETIYYRRQQYYLAGNCRRQNRKNFKQRDKRARHGKISRGPRYPNPKHISFGVIEAHKIYRHRLGPSDRGKPQEKKHKGQ